MTAALVRDATDALHRRREKRGAPIEVPELEPSRSYDAADLVALDMPEPTYIVRPYVPEGAILVCGRPKVGKTTLLRQLGFAANHGGLLFSARCALADVLFLSLEEGERIMRKKLAAD